MPSAFNPSVLDLRILSHIYGGPSWEANGLTVAELSETLGRSTKQVRDHLLALQRVGLVRRIDTTAGGRRVNPHRWGPVPNDAMYRNVQTMIRSVVSDLDEENRKG